MTGFVKYIFLYCLLLTSFICRSQNNKADSLLAVLKIAKEDTSKIKALSQLAWNLGNTSPDTAIILDKQALELAEKLSLTPDKKTAQFAKTSKGNIMGQLGVYYYYKGEYPASLSFQFKSLKIREENKDKKGISLCMGNIGNIYHELEDYDKALEYQLKGLKIAEEIGDKKNIATKLGNIGNVYINKKDIDKALEYYLKALKLAEELNDKNGISRHYGNIGAAYMHKEDNKTALTYYFKSLEIKKEIKDNYGIIIRLNNIGKLYAKTGKPKQAEKYMLQSLALADSIGSIDNARVTHGALCLLYEITGQYRKALLHYKKYTVLNDSITSKENTKKQTQLEMQYQFDKQQITDSLKNAETIKQEKLRHDQEIQQQKTYTYGGVIGFLLMMVVAGVSFRAYRSKQKTNEIISQQKQIVEMKQKEVLDSIHYAKRIQTALMTNESYIYNKIKHLKK